MCTLKLPLMLSVIYYLFIQFYLRADVTFFIEYLSEIVCVRARARMLACMGQIVFIQQYRLNIYIYV